jgi:hypothetical protein
MAAAARRAGSATLAGALLLLLLGSPACALRSQDEDWYKVLGVPRTAEPAVIRSAYRKLILKWHPGAGPARAQRSPCSCAPRQRILLPVRATRGPPCARARGALTWRRRPRARRQKPG